MPELKKRIAIASVLKPLNDSRMTEKIASSLANDPTNEVHVIGFPSALPDDSRITVHTFPSFKRLSFARWFASFRVLKIIMRVKPDILIVTTHELLFPALIAKTLVRSKIVYDVQENYYLNILHTEAFPRLLRSFIGTFVRLKERVAAMFLDHFLLAEKIYASQLPFVTGKATVVENKFKATSIPRLDRSNIKLIFSGTLSRSTGLFRAIELARVLYSLDQPVRLTVIGFVALERERVELQNLKGSSPFVHVIGGDRLVNHSEILGEVAGASAGIIAYELNPATAGRIPTKLYEYVGLGLPIILIQPDSAWIELLESVQHPFIQISAESFNAESILRWLKSSHSRGTFPQSMSWKSEEIKLQTAISAL
ncbi:MAG TPA: hypothetical protein VGD40_16265 [Chryseosolibacter sp.]